MRVEPKFRVKCEDSRDRYRAYASNRYKGITIFLVVCSVVILACAAVLWLFQDSDAWISALLGLVLLLLGLFQTRLTAWSFWSTRNLAAGRNQYCFDEDGFSVENQIETSRIRYSGPMKMVETKGYFLLYMEDQRAFVLPKMGFVEGNVQDFAAFLEEKTGKKFLRARSF